MKKRKKLIKRIGAVLCALVVAFSLFGIDCFKANASSYVFVNSCVVNTNYGKISYEMPMPPLEDGYNYYAIYFNYPYDYHFVASTVPFYRGAYSQGSGLRCSSAGKIIDYTLPQNFTLDVNEWEEDYRKDVSANYEICSNVNHFWANHDILDKDDNSLYIKGDYNFPYVEPSYNSSLGYLQNVSRKSTYIRGELYNYDEDSLTYHWYHDLQSTSGVDLTSGEYKIRHYISNATVKGYEKEDIVEMSEKYLMAEYDASQGYFSYLQKDYLNKLVDMGYEELGFIDTVFKGLFTLQHHYFQILNTSTNEVGGYLHFYPKDATGDSFGVEMEFEGLDDNFDVDENGPSGYIDTSTGSGETIEDALENADEPNFDDLSGVEEFIEVVKAYSAEVENVSGGVGALLGQFPPWVLGALGLSFALLIIGVVIGVMKG